MTDSTLPPVPARLPLRAALPFWLSLTLIPLVLLSAMVGGVFVILPILAAWGVFATLDAALGLNTDGLDPQTQDSALFWHRLITLIWPPLQFLMVFGLVWYIPRTDHLGPLEVYMVAVGIGVLSGSVGIVYAHELMHQKNKLERWLGDLLMTMALYGHFRSEHLLVHHRHVGTPRDPVTARYNESFWRFYPRVLKGCLRSSFKAEAEMLARKGLPWWHYSNPFWRYATLQVLFVALAFVLGGWLGIVIFVVQAATAIFQLEVVNYVEHYGLTRKFLGDGKYEHVKPRHSWNASHKASNWFLINLQRHSDHHFKPDRRFPLLQAYDEEEAPQLPYGYPVMTFFALFPRKWRAMMNPRVHAWRQKHYPEIEDWARYNRM
ncbi:alkane 1-monooxygenase [Marivita sp. S6314]|uniref:alkane 1-monooxygenase n=1 Tax=Marivita sp. S6314 TaxID=2926406 RepID=UPI001FF5E03D|nr:alkane 1-monooxygenase [Marivita sp. S6314]MCK0151437.1 alkane 1-monooxygenase [Marivita sp. S6314]